MREADRKRKFAIIQRELETLHKWGDGTFAVFVHHRDIGKATSQNLHSSSNNHWTDSPAVRHQTFKSDDDTDSPNAAWSWAAKHIYPWRFDHIIEREKHFRSWGYVMWDKDRLDQLEVMQLSADQYKQHGPKARAGKPLCESHRVYYVH
jgi:hypothetical protein